MRGLAVAALAALCVSARLGTGAADSTYKDGDPVKVIANNVSGYGVGVGGAKHWGRHAHSLLKGWLIAPHPPSTPLEVLSPRPLPRGVGPAILDLGAVNVQFAACP
jgi:hypothetical protein